MKRNFDILEAKQFTEGQKIKKAMDILAGHAWMNEIENNINFSTKHPYWKMKGLKLSADQKRMLKVLEGVVDGLREVVEKVDLWK